MKTKFSKLFVTILIVAAVTCCGALGVFAADDTADTAAAASSSVKSYATVIILSEYWRHGTATVMNTPVSSAHTKISGKRTRYRLR